MVIPRMLLLLPLLLLLLLLPRRMRLLILLLQAIVVVVTVTGHRWESQFQSQLLCGNDLCVDVPGSSAACY